MVYFGFGHQFALGYDDEMLSVFSRNYLNLQEELQQLSICSWQNLLRPELTRREAMMIWFDML